MNNNRNKILLDGDWNLIWFKNSEYICNKMNADLSTIENIVNLKYDIINAKVPGNFELDLYTNGIIDDPYFGTNPLKLQEYECMHMVYFRKFEIASDIDTQQSVLCFEAIDTISDIYVNGLKIASTDNMFIQHKFDSFNLKNGMNEIIVHIKPAAIEARKYDITPASNAMKYNSSSLYIRKAPHMYGWDIMPRILSGGIWRSVYIEQKPQNHIKDVFMFTNSVDTVNNVGRGRIYFNTSIQDDSLENYKLIIKGECGDSKFNIEHKLWHTSGNVWFHINDCKFWWPHNYGDPNLYNITVDLMYMDTIIDTVYFNHGVRTVELNRTSTTDKDGNGEFCFVINGKKIFAMGTNWVPVDAFHSNDFNRLPDILPMLIDIGCNIVRCWGGNVYEHDMFYRFCDENGIMVWQDFSMACAAYPQDREFFDRMEHEVISIVKQLRNYSSIILWSGDNECDSCRGTDRDPNKNLITRKIIPDVLDIYDFSRPYLPSSPYMDDYAYKTNLPISEDHLWGPRDYFKGSYYKNTVCHFASETGYHGCPSPESLKKYISADKLWPWQNNEEWLVHAASMEIAWDAPYAYRIKLMADQAVTLFGTQPDNLEDFAMASQISQAEAKKYFIERFRLSKWRRTGIIWWNLIDGWPQISDAVVDYYYDKKLAYYYIKRSQQPLCLMFDEDLTLYAVNENQTDCSGIFKVTTDKVLVESEFTVPANSSVPIWKSELTNEQIFHLIEWNTGDIHGKNHYMTNLINISFDEYKQEAERHGILRRD